MSELSEVQSTKDIAVVGLQPSGFAKLRDLRHGHSCLQRQARASGCLRQIPIRTEQEGLLEGRRF
jgi:hypothetical protein